MGFPPFAVECYVMYNFISLFRHQRGWEEDTYRLNQGKRVKLFLGIVSSLTGLTFCLCTYNAMDKMTVNSYWSDIKDLQSITREAVVVFKSLGITTPHKFLTKADTEHKRKGLASKFKVSEDEISRWIKLAELAELKGMGIVNVNLLYNAGIEHIPALAAQEPAVLHKKLLALNSPSEVMPLPREAIIRVWIREAQRRISN
jgi:hypothetical protein